MFSKLWRNWKLGNTEVIVYEWKYHAGKLYIWFCLKFGVEFCFEVQTFILIPISLAKRHFRHKGNAKGYNCDLVLILCACISEKHINTVSFLVRFMNIRCLTYFFCTELPFLAHV